MPRLKVCGINDAAFAIEAAQRGIDYLGLIFADGSPRRVTVEQAVEIVSAVRERGLAPRFVGVFVDHSVKEMLSIAAAVRLDTIQLHGDYGAEDVAALKSAGCEVWILHQAESDAEEIADAVLLDGRCGEKRGGTGMRADWSLVAPLKHAGRRVVLAGGISAENFAAAIATGADVIDINSSIETSPGNKSVELLDELMSVASHCGQSWKSV